jgi:glycosyltransferase involved in cell wall biosynthesis
VRTVHAVLPDGIDDPARPSGGNVYDRQVCRGLTTAGWTVHEHHVTGGWPRPPGAALAALADTVAGIPDDAVVLLDGLVASTAAEVLVAQAGRLRLVVLVHMPLGHRPPAGEAEAIRVREGQALAAVAAVVTTSAWTRERLYDLYGPAAGPVHVAEPGATPAVLAPGTADGGALLCVAAITPDKGHDVLLDALARIERLPWRCECVGSLERDPPFADALRRRVDAHGLGDRVTFSGPRVGDELDRAYAAADLLVLASRAETYGMVITEALARGLPVIAADVGGVTEALGHGADTDRPGLLVAPEDPSALADALRSWLSDGELRERWRRSARQRRASLPAWPDTARVLAAVLEGAAR